MLRWIAATVGTLALIAVAGLASVYLASEAHLRSFARPPAFDAPISTDTAAITRGEHLAYTRGCRGCHGDKLQGEFMWDYATAPNLPAYTRKHDVAVFEAALRHGIGADGRALYSMPSYNFVRQREPTWPTFTRTCVRCRWMTVALPAPRLPWPIRWNLARGSDKAIAGFLDLVPPLARKIRSAHGARRIYRHDHVQ